MFRLCLHDDEELNSTGTKSGKGNVAASSEANAVCHLFSGDFNAGRFGSQPPEEQNKRHKATAKSESAPEPGWLQLPPHVETCPNPDEKPDTNEIHHHAPSIVEQRFLFESTASMQTREKGTPSKRLILNQQALLINEVRDLSCRPKRKQVDVQTLWVGLINAKGTPQAIVLQDARAGLSKIIRLRDCDLVGAFKPNGSLRSSIGTLEPFRMAERQRTDPIHPEPGQQEQSEIDVGSSQKQIQSHNRTEIYRLRWKTRKLQTIQSPRASRRYPTCGLIGAPTTSTNPTAPKTPWLQSPGLPKSPTYLPRGDHADNRDGGACARETCVC